MIQNQNKVINLYTKRICSKVILLIICFITLMSGVTVHAYDENVMPVNLEECSGRTTIDSNVQGTITAYGRWVLRNNGTWSFNESFTTNGTSPNYDYRGEVYNRYSNFFIYWVYELPNGEVGQNQIYSIWVYLTCNM